MNIKRAKQEIKDTIEAYLLKDRYGAYEIPAIRQRPVLLTAARCGQDPDHGADLPGVPDRAGGLHHHSSHQTKRHRTSLYPGKDLQRPPGVGDGNIP